MLLHVIVMIAIALVISGTEWYALTDLISEELIGQLALFCSVCFLVVMLCVVVL